MGFDEAGGGKQTITTPREAPPKIDPLCCPRCACPLSRVTRIDKLTSRRRDGDVRREEIVIRKRRECTHCGATFWTRETATAEGKR